ncbi:MAG: hypothetical protein SCJ94_10150 [Bacillota bacterium]|nr:hypothetical protein [Bacillota bacterium]MDW7730349.1 hypothetical protein [Bacillota bacterium]
MSKKQPSVISYRIVWSREEALEHIKKESGKHFDPEVVKVFLQEIV